MANTRISDLTASASNLASTDLAPVVQTAGVGPVKMTGLQLAGGLLGSTTFNGSTVTTSSPVLNLTQTWNAGAVTFTGLKFNATDTASASGSLLLDLQVGSSSKVAVGKNGSIALNGGSLNTGEFNAPATGGLRFGSGIHGIFPNGTSEIDIISAGTTVFYITASKTTILGPTLQLGAADAAAPVAQTFKVQGVVAGTTNTAGANFTIQGSQGTGTGAGGSIIFQVAPAGSSGTAQNAYSTALTIASDKNVTIASGGSLFTDGYVGLNASNAYYAVSNSLYFVAAGATQFNVANGYVTIGGFSGGGDCRLYRDNSNTLALRNGTNAQTFRVYNSFDGTVGGNNEYGTFDWSTTSNVLTIGSVKTGTGIARNTNIISAGRLSLIQNSSEYIAIARGANAPGVWIDLGNASFNFRLGSNVAFGWSSAADASNNLDTILARGAAGVIGIGGTTSSFPALKRSTTTLQVRLADDTAFAPLSCGNTTASGTALDVSGTGAASIFNVVNTTTGTLLSVVNSSSSTLFSVNDAAATGVQVAGISFGLTGNISAAAWTTSGIRYRNVAATLTDTSSSGTVATAYTDVFGGNTIAASSSTTYTNYATFRLAGPTAGTNVTFTNSWALSLGGSLVMDDATNIAVGTTTGTKIGTSTSQKIGFWNAAPIAQPTTGVAAATVAATGTGDVVAASTTFDGYTIPQIVKAMRNAGLLA